MIQQWRRRCPVCNSELSVRNPASAAEEGWGWADCASGQDLYMEFTPEERAALALRFLNVEGIRRVFTLAKIAMPWLFTVEVDEGGIPRVFGDLRLMGASECIRVPIPGDPAKISELLAQTEREAISRGWHVPWVGGCSVESTGEEACEGACDGACEACACEGVCACACACEDGEEG